MGQESRAGNGFVRREGLSVVVGTQRGRHRETESHLGPLHRRRKEGLLSDPTATSSLSAAAAWCGELNWCFLFSVHLPRLTEPAKRFLSAMFSDSA